MAAAAFGLPGLEGATLLRMAAVGYLQTNRSLPEGVRSYPKTRHHRRHIALRPVQLTLLKQT
jgi:hypothetical protein